MTTILAGLVDTEDVLSDERVVDMSERIYKLQPDAAQFGTILGKLGAKDAVREKIEWLEDEYVPRVSAMGSATAESSDSSITVTAGAGTAVFRVNDIVRNMTTNEAMLVASVSANSIGFSSTATQRGLGGTSPVSSVSGAKLMVIGNACNFSSMSITAT